MAPLPAGTYKAKSLRFGVAQFQLFASSRPNPAVTRELPADTEVQIVAIHDGPPRFYQMQEGDWIAEIGVAPPAGFGASPVLDLGTHKVQPGFMGAAHKALAAPKAQPVRNVTSGEEFEIVAADGPDSDGVIWLQTKEGHWLNQAALEGGAPPAENFGGGFEVPNGPFIWPAGQSLPVDDRNVVFK